MKFEIWVFSDEGGNAWHFQPVDDPEAKYDAFLRYLDEQDEAEATLVHSYEADTLEDGSRLFNEYMGWKSVDVPGRGGEA